MQYEALIQRDRAGIAEAWFKLRRKSDGLFSNGLATGRHEIQWSAKGKMWRKLGDLRSHLVGLRGRKKYGSNTSWDDLEVVVIEVRATVTATLPVNVMKGHAGRHKTITVIEPLGDSAAEAPK